MATHNVEDGTGGLDGSIRMQEEQDRAEVRFAIWRTLNVAFGLTSWQNVGTGFANTFSFISASANRYASGTREFL